MSATKRRTKQRAYEVAAALIECDCGLANYDATFYRHAERCAKSIAGRRVAAAVDDYWTQTQKENSLCRNRTPPLP